MQGTPETRKEVLQVEIHSHVETLEETQCASVTSTPIKSVASSTSNFTTNYLLPATPVKIQENYNSVFNNDNPTSSVPSPKTPSCEQKLVKRPRVESDFEKEIVLTTRLSRDEDHDLVEIIDPHSALDENNEAFITPDKPDKTNPTHQPPPPPRHSTGGKKRFVTHTNLSEVVKAKKKLDFSAEELLPEAKPASFSLPKLHRHWFGKEPDVKHGAEHDCMSLMRVCSYKGTDFIQYVNKSTKFKLSKIKEMW